MAPPGCRGGAAGDARGIPGQPRAATMIRLVVSNQRGGVAKTTTAVTLASLLADAGKKVLLIDTDPQGSVHTMLGLKPKFGFYDAIITKMIFEDCLQEPCSNLRVL